jgi:site-specific recombinase XerD
MFSPKPAAMAGDGRSNSLLMKSRSDNRMEALLEDFLVYLRHERGQSVASERTYAGLLLRFIRWANSQGIHDWSSVQFNDLTRFLDHERKRALETEPKDSQRRLSSESVYLQIAALRAFYRFAETEKFVASS